MPNVTPRFLWQNFVQLSNTAITVSSEDLSFPRRWMLDPMKTMAWRSKIGWNVVAGFNDTIDFDLGISRVATLPAGNYATGADLATAVQTALMTAYGTGTWTVAYSTSTFKFTITHSASPFTLKPVSGANAYKTAISDLGWATDTSGNLTTTGAAVYQSRAYVKFDLASALGVDAVCLAGTRTMTSAGRIIIQGNGTDSWTSPSYTATVLATAQVGDIVAHWTASTQTLRWWRIIIDDPYRSGGYVRLGVPYIGSYIQLTQGPRFGSVSDGHERFSKTSVGDSGGMFVDVKTPAVRRQWDFTNLSDTEKRNLMTMQSTIDMKSQFFAMDPVTAPTQVDYGAVQVGDFTHERGGGAAGTAYWSVALTTQQQLQ
jgi:hypothetical protein